MRRDRGGGGFEIAREIAIPLVELSAEAAARAAAALEAAEAAAVAVEWTAADVAAEAAEREAAEAAGQRSGRLRAISRDLDLGSDLGLDLGSDLGLAAAPPRKKSKAGKTDRDDGRPQVVEGAEVAEVAEATQVSKVAEGHAEEMALRIARSPKEDGGRRKEGDGRRRKAAAEWAAAAPQLRSEEALRQAKAEGLVLRVAENKTGYCGVHLVRPGRAKPYQAQVWRSGKNVTLGSFATVEEAALCVARSPERRAAAERVAAAQRAAEGRGKGTVRGEAGGEAGGEAAARLQLGRWLYVVGRAEDALELLAAAGCAEHEAERCFLAGTLPSYHP